MNSLFKKKKSTANPETDNKQKQSSQAPYGSGTAAIPPMNSKPKPIMKSPVASPPPSYHWHKSSSHTTMSKPLPTASTSGASAKPAKEIQGAGMAGVAMDPRYGGQMSNTMRHALGIPQSGTPTAKHIQGLYPCYNPPKDS